MLVLVQCGRTHIVRKLFLSPTVGALVEGHQLINGDEKVTDICIVL